MLALADACQDRYVNAAADAYHAQPLALESADRKWLADKPHVVRCLEQRGIAVPSNATRDDILLLAIHDAWAQEEAGADVLPGLVSYAWEADS